MPSNDRPSWIPIVAAAATFAIHLAANPHYGFFRDELYFIVCGRNPALGARPVRAGEVQRRVLRRLALPRSPLHAQAPEPPLALVCPRHAGGRRDRASGLPLASGTWLSHARASP